MERHGEQLTGRVRYRAGELRTGWFTSKPVLVLQVEVRFPDGPPDWNGLPEYLGATTWRDAYPIDLCDANFPRARTPRA